MYRKKYPSRFVPGGYSVMKYFFYFLLFLSILFGYSEESYSQSLLEHERCYVIEVASVSLFLTSESKNDSIVPGLLQYAMTFRGVPYRYGANGPRAFDCSGFTKYVYGKFGYNLSRTAGAQFKNGSKVKKNSEKPGDLVFFAGRKGGSRIGHVGIVVEPTETGFYFIHASCSKGITVSHSTESYYKSRYLDACRVINEA